jgi:hypothetical protein
VGGPPDQKGVAFDSLGGHKLAGRPPGFQVYAAGLAQDAKELDPFVSRGIAH